MAKQRPAPSGSKAANARGRQPATPGPRRPVSGRAADPRPIPAPFLTHPPGTPDDSGTPAEPGTPGPDSEPGHAELTAPIPAAPPSDPVAAQDADTAAPTSAPPASAPPASVLPASDEPTMSDEPTVSNEPAMSDEPTVSDEPTAPIPVAPTPVSDASGRGADEAGDNADEPTQLIAPPPRPAPRPQGANRGPATGRAAAPGQALRRTVNQRGVARVPVRREQPAQRQELLLGLRLHPMVHVADMPAAVAFYEALGGALVHGDRDGEWVLMQVGTAQVGLVVRPPDPARGESTVELNFSAAMPLDRLEQLLRERGVTVVEVAADAELGTRLHVETPDGMPVKIHHVEPDPLV